MKRASQDKQAEYDLLQRELYKQLEDAKTALYSELQDWTSVFKHPVYHDAWTLWASHRNSCPECLHSETKVVNYDSRWGDGDVVCSKCGVYVRGYDAG